MTLGMVASIGVTIYPTIEYKIIIKTNKNREWGKSCGPARNRQISINLFIKVIINLPNINTVYG